MGFVSAANHEQHVAKLWYSYSWILIERCVANWNANFSSGSEQW